MAHDDTSTSATIDHDDTGSRAPSVGLSPLVVAAMASAGAGLVHAAAVGVHAEHVGLSRAFVAVAVAQLAAAVVGFVHRGPLAVAALTVVNVGAAAAWATTRVVGIGFVDGLTEREAVGFADTVAAALAVAAVLAALAASTARGRTLVRQPAPFVGAALLVGVLVVPAMVSATSHDHDHAASADGDHHDHDPAGDPIGLASDGDSDGADGHAHDDGHHDDGTHHDDPHDGDGHADDTHDAHHDDVAAPIRPTWPRPWDPTAPIDLSGVDGVTPEQEARATALLERTLAELPAFADVASLPELGYRSIGDARTGHEHFINAALISDDRFLDPSAPESLVYRVDGPGPTDRTLVSAMFIARSTAVDDPDLVDYGGPLMQWHVHANLCWGIGDDGTPKVMAVTDDHGGECPPGTVNAGADNPMVHVWIAPHPCGPFAALEGHGAGQVADDDATNRTDQCAHGHDDAHAGEHDAAGVSPVPYDPTKPIDLGGVEGVTLEQQAFAENLVAATIRDLPQWGDPAVAEAAGFRSIGDAATGHEHYIQWDWIDDDVWLDPRRPESLVFEPGPGGTKVLAAAMFMLPPSVELTDVPDLGGRLMQWHIHDDLCFTGDPETPRVAAVIEVGGQCPSSLVKMDPSPMIHVWIRSHECGPFAALDGIGGGQIAAGETRWCDHAHGG